MGLEVEALRGREARRLEPGLAPGVRSGLLATGERSVDPAALVSALATAATAAGVVLVRATVERLLSTPGGDRVTGVAVVDADAADAAGPAAGTIQAGMVVLAAGCRSAAIAGLPEHARPPVRPVKGQILTLRQPPGDPLVTRTLRAIVRGASVYLVPRDDGRVVVGATVEERGWDVRTTAGGAYELLRDALAVVPGLDDADLVAVRAGLRPASPDDLPMIGPGGVDGLVVATGHHRNGVLLTPVTADAVAAVVAGGPVPDEVAPCDPRRFAAARGERHETGAPA
jgi:glycine oxidase